MRVADSLGLKIEAKLKKTTSSSLANTVISQTPSPGDYTTRFKPVVLEVYILGNTDIEKLNMHLAAAGIPPIGGAEDLAKIMPPFTVGMKVEEAVWHLEEAGFKIKTNIVKTSKKVAANIVHAQDPMGQKVPVGSVVEISVYMFDPDALADKCSKAYAGYREAMNSENPDLEKGRLMVVTAEVNDCWFASRAKEHFDARSKAVTEVFKTETLCRELLVNYKESLENEHHPPNIDKGKHILSQAELCDWYSDAQQNLAQIERHQQDKIDQEKNSAVHTSSLSLIRSFEAPKAMHTILTIFWR